MELKTNPDLLKAILEAKKRKPTAAELRQQRVSFIYGSVDSSSGITRDRIKNVLDAQFGKEAA